LLHFMLRTKKLSQSNDLIHSFTVQPELEVGRIIIIL
jgi:hypothetical protein